MPDPLDVDRAYRQGREIDGGVPVAFHATQDPIASADATQCLARKTTIGVVSWDEAQITSVHNRATVREGAPSSTLAATSRACDAGPFIPRRLTPREWERLQGLPDDWTDIDDADDTSRYAAIGNSMAVPVMRWIAERIALVDAIVDPDDFGGGAP